MRFLKYVSFFILLLGQTSLAAPHHSSPDMIQSLLEQSDIYHDKDDLSLQEIERRHLFRPYHKPLVNAGITNRTIWLKLPVENDTNRMQHKVLVVRSNRLEHITLYHQNGRNLGYRGVSYRRGFQDTLYPFFRLRLPPHSRRVLYLKIHSRWSPVVFKVALEHEGDYRKEDKRDQLIKIFFLGMIASLMLYSLVLALYTRDKSYLFYSFYLASVVYQQLGFMGFSQVYLPSAWAVVEMKLVLPKVGLMMITTALFAMAFLRTRSIPFLHRGYQSLIVLGLIEIGVMTFVEQMDYSLVVMMGKTFVGLNILASLFNLVAAVIYYRHGNREARLYILGFGVLFASYFVWTLGTLGLSPMIYDHPNIIILGTTIEALILSLAFADRYRILQHAKQDADQRIFHEVQHREQIVQSEVVVKTAKLNQALEARELLLHEVHHRVKNNLQVILSIIRLQRERLPESAMQEQWIKLENRINAIARTYTMLLSDGKPEAIDLAEYVERLLQDITDTLDRPDASIRIVTDIRATIPLRESVYIGLIINELFTNAYKYAFDERGGTITISLLREGDDVILTVADDGRGFTPAPQDTSLGLKLIQALVTSQLRGTMETSSDHGTRCVVRFHPNVHSVINTE